MGLAQSVREVLDYLQRARAFPKYALERRLDALVAIYLPEFLTYVFGASVRHVAPEFPLRRQQDARSTNVDFLLHKSGEDPAWLLVELKTEADSLDLEQLGLYVEQAARGMRALRAEIDFIRERSRHKAKYERLLAELSDEAAHSYRVDVLCLAPNARSVQVPGVRFIGLDEFASWQPQEHRELWELLRPLLDELGAPRARPGRRTGASHG